MGSLNDPLVPLPTCRQKDITDDRSGSIFACLCDTDFCNDGQNVLASQVRSGPEIPSSSIAVKKPKLCPRGFDLVGETCYFISSERVGWIEARKKCESKSARLISLDSVNKRKSLSDHISQTTR